MTFDTAKDWIMPFGGRVGETLDHIASDDAGLKYLDWLVGCNFVNGRLKEALTVYLSDPSIRKELENLR